MPSVFHILKTNAEQLDRQLNNSKTKRIYNISIPHLAICLSFYKNPFIIIEDSDESALRLYNDLLFFSSLVTKKQQSEYPKSIATFGGGEIIYFPPSSSTNAIGERAKAIYKIASSQQTLSPPYVITSKDALMTGFHISDIENNVLTIAKGLEIKRESLQTWLTSHGYRNVSVVIEQGEYSRREWLFDIYPISENSPLRVEFFGDEIDLIRTFDIETQRSIKEINNIKIFPAEEGEPIHNLIHQFTPSPPHLFTTSPLHHSTHSHIHHVYISHLPFIGEGIDSGEMTISGMGILPEERKAINKIADAISKIDKQIVFVMSSNAQAERLKEIMHDEGVVMPIIEGHQLCSYEGRFCIVTGKLSCGINLPNILILTDKEIFGERPSYRPIRKSKASRVLISIDDLKIGDFVVHKDHGIGRFVNLQRQKIGVQKKSSDFLGQELEGKDDYEQDLITIEYANGKLYVPLHNINKIQKYSAMEGHTPSLDKLGGKTWQRTKQKVKKGIHEMAEKLLRLYAERKIIRGYKFSEDTPMHREFDDFFPYEETPDQIKSIEEIKKHLHSETPMDMLLCGDVGYGKTEIAMRAAFRAVYDGYQVAVLVPTTLLAEQHFRTFKARFSGFPIKIDCLSRFKSKADLKTSLTAISKGEIDIVIGTHILLNKDVQFHNLGLLIIDEEHRFGVAQKERLKDLKKGVDVLTLTATPIPRTLHMSLSGIREMCIIETPPEERLAVRSIVTTFNDMTIKEAIQRELQRQGQVFFVHNRIKDIEKIAAYIKKLIPDAKVAIAHGQMRELELEKIMLGFLNRETDVLVCTAIIGAGLDIVTANTIIINRADTFGLSDLYQLRGRVGRGNTQAYAYFLIPGEDVITDDAKKRLQSIQEMSYLGAGFRLAMRDLEIRGAGNLLGREQSGHIYRVGFDMYMEMLEKTVSELKGEEIKEEVDTQIKIRISAFIPDDYISDITLRLSIYRRISALKSLDELSRLRDEIIDRFGKPPEEVNNLLHIMKIKILSRLLYISSVSDLDGKYRFSFVSDTENKYKIPEDFFDRLLKILFEMQKKEKKIRFLPDGFELNMQDVLLNERIEKVEDMLQVLWTRLSK
ncbi:transcription-repair-coupling factor [Dissulfurispira thermophila]|uniref:Transcription-repair-coupling factor n=1 Tax=Dissulfurispira thermophila TaxID=2715679 RepID=A0A7G1H0T2_9BACT|nr:transcription-repair coupling factor [Dissulfurispira thermophila]BCB95277.1 transcription-repair-coupling factor [Dissulfurispira thermophila]